MKKNNIPGGALSQADLLAEQVEDILFNANDNEGNLIDSPFIIGGETESNLAYILAKLDMDISVAASMERLAA